MKKIITLIHSAYIFLGALFLFSFIGFKASAAQIDITTDDFEPTSVLAIIRTGGEISLFSEFNNNSVLTKLDELGISEAENLDMSNSSEISLFSMGDRVNTYKLTLTEPGVENVKDTVARLNEMSDVIAAEPNYYVYLYDTPDDYYYKQNLQYGLDKISAPDVWNLKIDASDVAVAVVDSGVRTTHEDLKNNIWTNPGEIPDNGIDDDENGFIDDVHGWDFYNNDNVAEDVMGHGTHVAGIVSAQTNNSVGVASLARNAKIVPVKVFGNGTTTVDLICKGLNYIKKMGFPIANCSLGSMGGGAAMAKIMNECTNTVFACAAGNAEEDENGSYVTFNIDENPRYPAACDCENIISVASSDSNDNLSSFSNYGVENVDIAAPGTAITSTYINGTSNCAYAGSNGTSMACPYVASTAAVMKAKYPDITPTHIISKIISSADIVPALSGYVKNAGRLNAYEALKYIDSISIDQTAAMLIGETLTLTPQVIPADTLCTVTWSSDNTSVATVENGVITAVGCGSATITAECGGLTSTCIVTTPTISYSNNNLTNQSVIATVENVPPDVEYFETSHTFEDNGTWDFVLTDADGNSQTLTAQVTWIDKIAPTADVIYSETTPTREDVAAMITNISEDVIETERIHIFTDNGEYYFKLTDKAGNTAQIKASVTWIDKTPPTAKLKYSTDRPTNQDVTVTLTNISEEIIETEKSHTFTENGIYFFTLTDKVGNSTTLTAQVSWIDKIAPTAEVSYSPSGKTNENVLATLTKISENIQETETSYLFTENGEHAFTLTDTLGNRSTIKATVDWIDRIPPTAEMVYSELNPTRGDVTVSLVNISEELKSSSETQYTFTENGKHPLVITDLAGNRVEFKSEVSWIDKTPPEATVVYSTTDPTNKNVTATLSNFSEDVTDDSEREYIFTENGEHTFVITDKVGNTSNITASVDWIDRTPPTAEIRYSTVNTTNGNVITTVVNQSEELSEDSEMEYTFTENGKRTVVIYDKAGNKTELTAAVDWIDKEAPTAVVKYSTNDLTNTDVTASLDEVSFDVETIPPPYTFSSNGEHTFTITDMAGNSTDIKAVVDWIDKIAPLAEVKYSTTEKTQEPVTVWLENLSEEIREKLDELRFTFEENGTHNFKITDMAGNESDITAQVSWIEKPEPTPEPTPVPVKDYVEFARSGSIVEARLVFQKTPPPPASDIAAYAVFKKDGIMKRAVLIKPTEDMKVSFIVGSEFEDCDISLYIWDEDMKPLMEIQSFQ